MQLNISLVFILKSSNFEIDCINNHNASPNYKENKLVTSTSKLQISEDENRIGSDMVHTTLQINVYKRHYMMDKHTHFSQYHELLTLVVWVPEIL